MDIKMNKSVFLGVGAVCLVALRIPMAGRETATAKNPIDTVGLILLIIGVGCLQLMLDEGKDKDWFASGYIVILGVLTVVGLVLLVAWELTEEHPTRRSSDLLVVPAP